MRPSLLNPLFADAAGLKGVGDKMGKLLAKVLGRGEQTVRVVDLALRLPSAISHAPRP